MWKLRWLLSGRLVLLAIIAAPRSPERESLVRSLHAWGVLWRETHGVDLRKYEQQ